MIRRAFLQRLSLFTLVALAAGGAHADPVEEITDEIRSQGFNIVRVQRTWLGRVRIIGLNDNFRREVVIDPTTGEIRRDLLVPRTNPDGPTPPSEPSAPTEPAGPKGATRGLDKIEGDDAPGEAEPDATEPDAEDGSWGGGWGPSGPENAPDAR